MKLQSVAIDYRKLKQTIFNLLTNALKYTPTHEPIDISLQLEKSQIIVVVEDKGIGIPKAEIDRIWELFYRADNVQSHRGMGLGLYIVKKLVHAMSGTITVHSNGVGQGTRFTLGIPANPQQAQSGSQVEAELISRSLILTVSSSERVPLLNTAVSSASSGTSTISRFPRRSTTTPSHTLSGC